MEFVKPDRKIINIAVLPSAKKCVENFSNKYQLREYAVASRMYEWFADQDDIFQRSIMGMLHGLEKDAATAYMKKLKKSPPTLGE